MSRQVSHLLSRIGNHARARHADGHALIQELRLVYPNEVLALLLGINVVGLGWRKHPMPVCRAALMLHLLTFSRGDSVTVFDILTNCRYTSRNRVKVRRTQAASPATDRQLDAAPQPVVSCGVASEKSVYITFGDAGNSPVLDSQPFQVE